VAISTAGVGHGQSIFPCQSGACDLSQWPSGRAPARGFMDSDGRAKPGGPRVTSKKAACAACLLKHSTGPPAGRPLGRKKPRGRAPQFVSSVPSISFHGHRPSPGRAPIKTVLADVLSPQCCRAGLGQGSCNSIVKTGASFAAVGKKHAPSVKENRPLTGQKERRAFQEETNR